MWQRLPEGIINWSMIFIRLIHIGRWSSPHDVSWNHVATRPYLGSFRIHSQHAGTMERPYTAAQLRLQHLCSQSGRSKHDRWQACWWITWMYHGTAHQKRTMTHQWIWIRKSRNSCSSLIILFWTLYTCQLLKCKKTAVSSAQKTLESSWLSLESSISKTTTPPKKR